VYLKVDVEGHEPSAFKSGRNLFQEKKILNVFFEFTYKIFGR